MNNRHNLIRTAALVRRETHRTRVSFLAAAVAYFGFVSILPLLWLALAVGNALGAPIGEASLNLLGQLLTADAQAALLTALSVPTTGGVTVVGVAVLTWSGLKVFRALDTAFSLVYGVSSPESIFEQLRDASVILFSVPFAIGMAALLGVLIPYVVGDPYLDMLGPVLGPYLYVLGPVLLLLTLIAVFFPIYYVFPDIDLTLRETLPGACFASIGWSALATGFGLYTGYVQSFQLYGTLGAGLLLVTWMYLGGIIIMVGAVVNAVLAGRIDDDTDRTDPVDSDDRDETPDLTEVARDVSELRDELEEKTVSRSALEDDLEQYIRRRMRRGRARGWGPYLVLLYGTVMTLGAFFWLSGGWAILAMIVVWLSTLGLYVLMVLFGIGIEAVGVPGRILDRIRDYRS